MDLTGFLLKKQEWLIEPMVVLLLTFFVAYLYRKIFSRLMLRAQKSTRNYDDVILGALHYPFVSTIWITGVWLGIHVVHQHVKDIELFNFLPEIRDVLLVAICVWFFLSLIGSVEERIMDIRRRESRSLDHTTLRAVSQITRVVFLVIGALFMLQALGISVSGVWAAGGIGGIGVALAAKDLLANFFGGLMIFLDRPFEVGDWIRSPDKEIEGTVEYIGWRLTRIRTFDKRPRYIPNGVFSNIIVDNPSRMSNRRIKTVVGLRYEDGPNISVIIKDIEAMLRAHPEIDTNQTLMVNLINFGSSTLDILIYTFTKTVNWVKFQNVQQDVFLKILDVVAQHDASCAYPSRTLYVNKDLSAQEIAQADV